MTRHLTRQDLRKRFGDLQRRSGKKGDDYTATQQADRREFAKVYQRAVEELLSDQGWEEDRRGAHCEWYLRRGPTAQRRATRLLITPENWVLKLAFSFASGLEAKARLELEQRIGVPRVSRAGGAHPIHVCFPLVQLLGDQSNFASQEEAVFKVILNTVAAADGLPAGEGDEILASRLSAG